MMLTCLTSPLADLVAIQTDFWFDPYWLIILYALELALSQEAHVVSVSQLFNKIYLSIHLLLGPSFQKT